MRIRKATRMDASKILRFMTDFLCEDDLLIPAAMDEFKYTVEQEGNMIDQLNSSQNSIFMIAEDNEQVIGVLTSEGGKRKANFHVTTLGMSVQKNYRNRGIGYKMLQFLIEWAKLTKLIHRIELFVYERNKPAIHLYKKAGFKIEGKRINAFFKDGRYDNDLIMALYV